VNNCPTKGYEHMAGARTTIRFLNGPRSIRWMMEMQRNVYAKQPKKMPPELINNELVVAWAKPDTVNSLKRMLPGMRVVRAFTRFRRECVQPTFWSDAELRAHKERAPRLEITFGFEAVAHALYNCERVSIYGFFLDEGSDDIWKKKGRHDESDSTAQDTTSTTSGLETDSAATLETPYHYYENHTVDKAAKDPNKPWTYRYHNFELEHSKYRQLENVCWLRIITK